ncbi:MAG TPA: type IV secretory system conjugative DNA transfer family protein [Solirubrobacteraceae bacterium]|jgi:type IV secretion system protein VirD4|nr:type IV secretory system conjugative DNA transfer family protein [Solirubrobacteraceae bacterium]
MNARHPAAVSDGAVLAIVGLVVAVAGGIWLWGGVAGAVFGRGWAAVSSSGVLTVITHLPRTLGDPARAWPRGARRLLPGTAGVYGALVLVLVLGGAAATVAVRMGLASRPARSRRGGARWAGGGELRPLHSASGVRRSATRTAGRLALGRYRGRLLYAEERHALVAFGPPQSGKSAGLAVPALLEWDGPAVASSIKTDLLACTLTRRRAQGEVFVFDPFELAGMPAQTWSPLGSARAWDGALEVAWRLAAAGELDQRGVEGGDFWAIAAEQRLAPLLFAAARAGLGMDAVVRWAYGQGSRELYETISQLTGSARDERELEDAHAAYDAVRAFEGQADRTRSSIEATAQGLLRAYRFARVLRSARSCEISADRLLDQRATLYLIGDAKASKLLRPIFLALLSEIVDRAYERATLAGGRLELPLLLCLDEAGNVAPLPNLAEIASTAPSHNIQLVSIFHDLAQARSRYGRQAETVVNSHRARMLLPGVADLDTLRYFSSLAGEEETPETTRTTGADGASRTRGIRRRPLIAPEELRQLDAGQALLLYGRLAPAVVRLRMWFADRRLRRLAAGQKATGDIHDARAA